MREIKYKAWTKHGKTMLSPSQVNKYRTWGLWPNFFSDPNLIPLQYTELKDSKNIEIYESYILEIYGLYAERIHYEVMFKDGCFVINIDDNSTCGKYPCNRLINFIDYSKIVGNIYENSELLKYPIKGNI